MKDHTNITLPDGPRYAIVRKAYEYARSRLAPLREEEFLKYRDAIDKGHRDTLALLDRRKAEGKLTQEQYDRGKEAAVRLHDNISRQVRAQAGKDAKDRFVTRGVGAALEIMRSDNPSPDLMAAAILRHVTRSALDCDGLKEVFNWKVRAVVARIQHIDMYPARRARHYAEAPPYVRQVVMAEKIARWSSTLRFLDKRREEGVAMRYDVPFAKLDLAFRDACILWDADEKMGRRFAEVFNRVADHTSTTWRIEIDAAGRPLFVDNPALAQKTRGLLRGAAPSLPPRPAGFGTLGGSVFFDD